MMSESMVILVNGEALFEYDRTKPLAEMQKQYLEQMDKKMDQGITLGQEAIKKPNQQQRAQYVAFTLLSGIDDDNEATIAAMSSYLAIRLPELKQVKADVDKNNGKVMFDLIFDNEHKNQVKVSFNS